MGNVDNSHVLWMVRASRDREAANQKTRGHFDQISLSKFEGGNRGKKLVVEPALLMHST